MKRPVIARCVRCRVSATALTCLLFALFTSSASIAAAQGLTINVGSDLGTYSIGPTEIPLTASGGSGTYTWSIIAGTAPPGVVIRTDGPSWFPPNASAGLIGVATTPGSYTVTLRVNDGAAVADKQVTIRITVLSVLSGFELPHAFVGVPFTHTLAARSFAGATFTWTATGALPPGLSLGTDGVLSGTPTSSGFFNVPFSVSDGTDTLFWNLNLAVYAVQITTDGLLPAGIVNQPYTRTFTASGGTGAITFTVPGGLPPGITMIGDTISGTPSQTGRWIFNLTATDANNNSYTKQMVLWVSPPLPLLPGLTPNNGRLDDCPVGGQCDRGVGNWFGGRPPFTWTATGLPDGMSIETIGDAARWGPPGDGHLFGKPRAIGQYNVTITVTDANGRSASHAFPFRVTGLMQTDFVPNGTLGVAFSKRVRVIGGSGSYVGTNTGARLPAGVGFNGATLVVSGTPQEGGGFNPEFTFDDGQGQVLTQTNYFTIASAGDPAVNLQIGTDGDLGTASVNAPYSFQLWSCCVPVTWSLENGSLPAGLSFSTAGVISGTPTVVGSSVFTVRATDAAHPGNYTTRRMTLTVSPVFVTTNYTLPFGNHSVFYHQQLQASGGSGSYIWSLASGFYLPTGLTLTSGGRLSGTPASTGQFQFRVNVVDTNGNPSSLHFTLLIYPLGQHPPLSIPMNANFGTFHIGEIQYALTARDGSGQYTWSLVGGSLPPGLSVRPDGPPWFPPNASGGVIGIATTPGTYHFTLRIDDGVQTVDLPATMTITPLTFKDWWTLPDAFQGVPYSYTLTALNNITPVTWNVTFGMPPGLTLNSTTGEISGTPTTPGFYNVNVSATADGATVFRSFNIPVYAIRLSTSTPLAGGVDGELPNATPGQPYTATIVATGGAGGYTFSTNFLPGGLALDPQTGVISGTFTFGPGRFSTFVTATDTNGISYSRSFSIRAIATPAVLPSVSPGDRLADCTFAWPCVRTVFSSNGALAPLTWSASGLPPGMSIRFGGASGTTSSWVTPGDVELWGAPTQLGDFNVTITVTNATGAQATNTFPLHVSELELNSSLPTGTYATGYSSRLRIIGGTMGYTAAIVNPSPSSRLPLGLTLDAATQIVSGTPLETGGFSPDLVFTDSATPTAHTLHLRQSIFIAGPGTSTIQINHNGDLGTLTVGSTLNTTVFACCLPSTKWSIVSGTAPANLALTPQAGNNNVQLTAPSLVAGTYTFVLKVENTNDPNNFAVRQFTLTVTTLTFPSGFPFTLPFGNVGVPYSQQLQINGATGSPAWSLAPYNYLPPGLTLTSAGLLSGTPAASGQFGFRLDIADAAGQTHRVFLNLAIYPQGQTPPLFLNLSSTFGPLAIGQFTIQFDARNTTGGVPPYHYSLSPGANVVPGMRVQDGPPLPTFFFSAFGGFIGVIESPGVYTTSIRVTDSANPPHTFDKEITVKVSSVSLVSQTSLPKALVNTPYSFTIRAIGGSGNYAWSATNLPNGITIDAATGEVHGTPTAAGSSFPTVTVTDQVSHESVSAFFFLQTNAFDITTPGMLSVGTQAAPYSVQLAQTGCTGTCTWSVPFNILPAGLTITSDGLIAGTPTAPFNSFFTVRLAGATASVDKVMSLIIKASPAQALSMVNTGTIGPTTVGNSFAFALTARGGTPPYSWSLDSGALPRGITLVSSGDAESGSFAPGVAFLTGKALQVGTHTFTLRVTDAMNASTTRAFTWIVSAIAQQYFSLPLTGTTLTRGVSYSQFLLALGGSGQYTWSATMPAGLTLNSSTGEVSGTPLDSGSFSVPITVSDSAGRTITNFITMNIGGGVVTFNASSQQGPFLQGGQAFISLNPSGGTPPYTITAVTPLPPGFAIEPPSAVFQGSTPGSGYALAGTPLATGTFTFTLRLQDSASNTSERTFTLLVSPVAVVTNNGLLPNRGLTDGSVNAPYSQQLLAVNAAGPVLWSVAPGSALPAGLTLSSSGLLSGTPTAAGTYSFSVNITDVASGLVVSPGTYTLKISPLAISAPAVLPMATASEPYSYTFAATGATGAVTWSLGGGSVLTAGLTLSPNGTLSGTPANVLGATSRLVVTATDSANNSITRRFTLFIRTRNVAPPTFPTAQTPLPDATVGQVFAFALNPTAGLAPLTWSVAPGSSLPPGLALLTGAQLAPTAFPGVTWLAGQPTQAGQFSFDLIVTDAEGRSTTRTFRLNVSAISILSGTPPNGIVNGPYAAQFTAVGGTPPYVFTITRTPAGPRQEILPPGLAFSSAGLISGTPTATGTFSFVVQVQDAASHTFARPYNLTVTNSAGLAITSGNPFDIYVGGGFAQDLFTNGSSTYAWTLAGGSLPPGISIGTDPQNPAQPALVGQPSAPGLYTYTLRATDTANGANTADRLFHFNVGPMQITSPPMTILSAYLPPAQVGVAYSTVIKAAGGTPPYTFAVSSQTPLPAGLTLGADGILSGTPTQNGSVGIVVVVTDASGGTLYSFTMTLLITPAGTPPPLVAAPGALFGGEASVGVPYQFPLVVHRGGVAPFSWSVAPGSSLPPGLAVVSGNGAVSGYLAGVPTTAGSYSFSLVVSDSSGQSVSVPLTLNVSPIALTPNSIPSGRVGTAYSVSLVPSGGTGPYTIQALSDWDMPPGLNLVGATLSGTPTHAGSWLIRTLVTDSATPPNTLSALFEITIDNALGEAPAVTFGQRSIQITYVQGSPAPAPVPVSIGSTSGAIGFDVAIEGLPGATLSAATGTTPSTVSLDVHAPALAAGSHVGVLALKAAGAANVIDAVPVLVAVVVPPPCEYTIAPASGSMSSRGGRGSFALNTAATCAWNAAASAPWITITTAPNGSGAATIGYSVALNNGAAQRSGTITVGGQVYTITQFGTTCSFAIKPLMLSAPASGGTASVDLTASGATCSWSASGLDATPASGTGSAKIGVTIPPNAAVGSRTLTATIAGQTFTVNQAGIDCTVNLTPLSAAFSDAGGTGSFNITTPAACSYATTSSPNWVTIESGASGTGPGTLLFSVTPNSATTPRSGSIVIGGESFSISQAAAACSVTLDTSTLGSPFGVAGGTGTIGVTANGSNCPWTASSPVNWVTPAPNASSGSGTVTITVAANGSVSARSTTLTIAGQSVTVSQAGQACTFSLASSTGAAPASGGSGSVGVLTPSSCSWQASSNDPTWLSVSPPASTGSGDAQFVALANPNPSPRTGTLTIAGLTFTVTQAAAPCSYTLSAAGATVPGDGATGASFSLTGPSSCTPAPVSFASWITVDQTTFVGGAGSVSYSVQPNPLSAARNGVIQVGEQSFTITQAVSQSVCRYSLHTYGAVFNRGGGGGDVFGSGSDSTCNPAPTIGTDMPSFVTLGPLSGPVLDVFTQPFTIAPFNTPLTAVIRRGRITFGGQIFIIKQVSW